MEHSEAKIFNVTKKFTRSIQFLESKIILTRGTANKLLLKSQYCNDGPFRPVSFDGNLQFTF